MTISTGSLGRERDERILTFLGAAQVMTTGTTVVFPFFADLADWILLAAGWIVGVAGTGAASAVSNDIGIISTFTSGAPTGTADTDYFVETCALPAGASLTVGQNVPGVLAKTIIPQGAVLTSTTTTLANGPTVYPYITVCVPNQK